MDAINDGNVLPFRIDYINTVKQKDNASDKEVSAIDTERALAAPGRVSEIVKYILEHFDQKTKRSRFYSLKGQRMAGFNSIFAVASIPMAMKYYTEFKKQLAESGRKLTVATIFSYNANEADPEDALPDEDFDTGGLDKTSRDFLESAIALFGDKEAGSVVLLKNTDLSAIIAEEKLKPEETRKFIDNSFRDGTLKTIGTDIDKIMPLFPALVAEAGQQKNKP